MKKILFALVVLVFGGLAIIFALFPFLIPQFLSGEDGWLCQGGEWVKHGNPSGPRPTIPCAQAMSLPEAVFLVIWAVVSFLIAFSLQRRYAFFQKLSGVAALFGCSVLFVLLHNLIYGLFYSFFSSKGTDEPVFFILSLLSFGVSIFLLVILAVKKVLLIK